MKPKREKRVSLFLGWGGSAVARRAGGGRTFKELGKTQVRLAGPGLKCWPRAIVVNFGNELFISHAQTPLINDKKTLLFETQLGLGRKLFASLIRAIPALFAQLVNMHRNDSFSAPVLSV